MFSTAERIRDRLHLRPSYHIDDTREEEEEEVREKERSMVLTAKKLHIDLLNFSFRVQSTTIARPESYQLQLWTRGDRYVMSNKKNCPRRKQVLTI